ncbi:MAG: hypothetical protein L0Y56_13835, partial [Nitrospira sp.]|nr:hypothetical protein [Nitrospira sp.]
MASVEDGTLIMMDQTNIEQRSNRARANPLVKLLSLNLRNDLVGYVFVLPWIIGLLVFRFYPIIASFYYSFTEYSVLQPARWTGLQNYQEMFTHDPLIWQSVYNTLYYTLISVPFGLLLALLLALLMNQAIRGIGFYRT